MRHADRHLLLNALSFSLIYHCTNWLAVRSGAQQHVMLAAEQDLPFVAWMILPYSLSLLFFALPFWLMRKRDDLPAIRQVSHRFLLATTLAGLVFLWWPLRQQHMIPSGDVTFGIFYQWLHSVDQPYNQLPSLHVVYACLGWYFIRPALRLQWQRFLLDGAAVLLMLSTLFTYQHHLADVVCGIALAACCLRWRFDVTKPGVALYYTLAAVWAVNLGIYSGHWWLLYPALSWLLVARAYQHHRANFLNKQDGKFNWQSWLLYAPYLLSYRISWLIQRFLLRRDIQPRHISAQWMIGPRLNAAEARRLTTGTVVVDCSAELSEQPVIMARVIAGELTYLHIPMLDIVQPDPVVCDALLATLQPALDQGKTIYLHCAMGFYRCRMITARIQETS